MTDFNVRADNVDVEQIMKQIRSRIREKRGVDYTEEQVRELATVRLEKFLDPKNLRSDLLDQFRKSRPAVAVEPPQIEPPYTFDDQTLFASHRGPLRIIRKLLMPVLKLFFNPNTLNQILHTQAQFNVDLLKREARRKIEFDRSRAEWNALYYEVLHNLVLETTRTGIEVKNLKMRVEALASRLDFAERRVRALEGVVQYRPEAVRPPRDRRPQPQPDAAADALATPDVAVGGETGGPPTTEGGSAPAGDGTGRRRRRRRRGRRGLGQPQPGGQDASSADGGGNASGPAGPDGSSEDDDRADDAGDAEQDGGPDNGDNEPGGNGEER